MVLCEAKIALEGRIPVFVTNCAVSRLQYPPFPPNVGKKLALFGEGKGTKNTRG